MKRKRQTYVAIACGACHCRSELDVTGLTAHEIRSQRESLIFCNECSDKIQNLELDDEIVYFQSHFSDSVVLISSHLAVRTCPCLEFDRKPFPPLLQDDAVNLAVSLLKKAGAIIILAGSGMSADSGLSTFRPAGGKSGPLGGNMHLLPLEEACYSSKPEKAWYYDAGYRRSITAAEPHEGYSKLLQILQHLGVPWFVVTTNIDRYFTLTGFPDEQVYETHGNIDFLQCSKRGADRCSGVFQWPNDIPAPALDDGSMTCDLSGVPACPSCGAMARMNISHLPDEPVDVDGSIKSLKKNKAVQWLKCQHRLLGPKKGAVNGGLLVLEVGCGATAHGLQGETDLLLSRHPQLGFLPHGSLIRINHECGLHPAALQSDCDNSPLNGGMKVASSAVRAPRVSSRLKSKSGCDHNGAALCTTMIGGDRKRLAQCVGIKAGALQAISEIHSQIFA